ncbi:hypothetical protein SBADM41S_07920 [Streptomyces badius]
MRVVVSPAIRRDTTVGENASRQRVSTSRAKTTTLPS